MMGHRVCVFIERIPRLSLLPLLTWSTDNNCFFFFFCFFVVVVVVVVLFFFLMNC